MTTALVVTISIALGLLVAAIVGPLVAQLRLRQWRSPRSEDADRLAHLCPDLMPAFSRTAVIETVGDASVEVAFRGPPGRRVLFVTDFVLHELDEEAARSLLAAEAARTRVLYREYQAVAAAVVIGLGTASFLLVVPFELGFGGMVLAAAVLLAGGRQLQYRADAMAAEVVGAETLAASFEAIAGYHDLDLSTAGWRRYLEVQPALGDRIRRLRRTAAER